MDKKYGMWHVTRAISLQIGSAKPLKTCRKCDRAAGHARASRQAHAASGAYKCTALQNHPERMEQRGPGRTALFTWSQRCSDRFRRAQLQRGGDLVASRQCARSAHFVPDPRTASPRQRMRSSECRTSRDRPHRVPAGSSASAFPRLRYWGPGRESGTGAAIHA